MRHGAAGCSRNCGEDFLDRKPLAGAEVKCAARMPLHQEPERVNMGCRKIRDMDMVANCGTIWRIIVIAKHRKIFQIPLQRHHHPRNEMSLVPSQFRGRRGQLQNLIPGM